MPGGRGAAGRHHSAVNVQLRRIARPGVKNGNPFSRAFEETVGSANPLMLNNNPPEIGGRERCIGLPGGFVDEGHVRQRGRKAVHRGRFDFPFAQNGATLGFWIIGSDMSHQI